MKKQLYIVMAITTLLMSSITHAQSNYFIPTLAGSSAAMIGLGNVEGFNNDASVIFDNPAALYRINKGSLNMFTTTFLNEVSYKNAAVAARMKWGGVLSAGYMTVGVDGIPETMQNLISSSNAGTIKRTGRNFGYNNAMGKIGYQFSQSRNLHWGVSGVFYNTKIDSVTGSGYNIDTGVMILSYPFTFSIAAKNILSSQSVNYSNGNSEALPLEMNYALQYKFNRSLKVFGQIKSGGNSDALRKSAAISYRPSFLRMLELSAGYKEFPVLTDVKRNMTLGLGLRAYNMSFNYAYEKSDHVLYNHKHYFSVGLHF